MEGLDADRRPEVVELLAGLLANACRQDATVSNYELKGDQLHMSGERTCAHVASDHRTVAMRDGSHTRPDGRPSAGEKQ